MTKVDKPWGYEIIWAASDRIAGKLLHIKKGHRLSLQYHEQKEEAIYVIGGELFLTTALEEDGERFVKKLGVGEAYHIYPGNIHRFEARTTAGDLIVVSTPELKDVVRIEDDYKRD